MVASSDVAFSQTSIVANVAGRQAGEGEGRACRRPTNLARSLSEADLAPSRTVLSLPRACLQSSLGLQLASTGQKSADAIEEGLRLLDDDPMAAILDDPTLDMICHGRHLVE